MCGEQVPFVTPIVTKLGSSPRVRGTVLLTAYSITTTGIIPACAGNSAEEAQKRLTEGDHPRVCGEQIVLS